MQTERPHTIRSRGSSLAATAVLVATLAIAPLACTPSAEPDGSAAPEDDTREESPVPGVEFRHLELNGIQMRIAEAGSGPLVLLAHGFPESWYSWRHQLPALAAAGYHAVAPDMRGYGSTDAPAEVEAYDVHHLCGDLVGVMDALGQEQAVLVGHDWGALVVWNCSLLAPDRVRAVAALSVPYGGRGARSLIESLKETYGDNFFYILYFQERDADGNGVAEAEFDAAPREIISRLYTSPTTPREPAAVTDPLRAAGGWIPRLGRPTELPAWLTQADLDYYVGEFERAGFRGGINYYRNFHRNWETTPELAGVLVPQPSLFIAGEKDGVIRGADEAALQALIGPATADLRGVHVVPEVGHWVQQEAPEEVNRHLLDFLAGL